MKFLLLFMFVAVALADQESETTQEITARNLARVFLIDRKDSLECANKSEARLEDLQYIEDVIDLNDTEITDMKSLKRASCAIVCCGQKMGIIVGGVVQVEELLKYFQKVNIEEDTVSQMRNIVSICKQQMTETSDECMAGYKFMKCTFERSRSLRQTNESSAVHLRRRAHFKNSSVNE